MAKDGSCKMRKKVHKARRLFSNKPICTKEEGTKQDLSTQNSDMLFTTFQVHQPTLHLSLSHIFCLCRICKDIAGSEVRSWKFHSAEMYEQQSKGY